MPLKSLSHEDLLNMASMPLGTSAAQLGASGGRVIGALVLALGVVAAVEYAASWYRLERELRMTRQELTDETKQQDGDPKVKQRMRSRARALAKKRSIQSVKEATVVVTNPTHVAVALRYGPQDAAPVVVSKGHDAVALRIRAEARKHGIPILENRPLARAIDAEVEIGQFVPSAHFAAVARILAFVYRLKAPRTALTN
jgi:flagellar biosynthetic protein FlhB